MSLKPDGTLPLPYSYKFLEEVFRYEVEDIKVTNENNK